jgi:hypothetical protein
VIDAKALLSLSDLMSEGIELFRVEHFDGAAESG